MLGIQYLQCSCYAPILKLLPVALTCTCIPHVWTPSMLIYTNACTMHILIDAHKVQHAYMLIRACTHTCAHPLEPYIYTYKYMHSRAQLNKRKHYLLARMPIHTQMCTLVTCLKNRHVTTFVCCAAVFRPLNVIPIILRRETQRHVCSTRHNIQMEDK